MSRYFRAFFKGILNQTGMHLDPTTQKIPIATDAISKETLQQTYFPRDINSPIYTSK